jgi:hypothetical protein
MFGFIGTSVTITVNYNCSQSVVAKTRSTPYWTTGVFSSAVTDLVLVYGLVTSSASAVRWSTLHSWTLNFWILLRLNYDSGRTEYRSPQLKSSSVILCLFVATGMCSRNRCSATDYSGLSRKRVTEPLASNGPFRISGVMSQYYFSAII